MQDVIIIKGIGWFVLSQVDILHPLASLEWRKCRGPPVDVSDSKAVWLKDKVYVGAQGGATKFDARLYIYTPTTDTWTWLDIPVRYHHYDLTTYHSQLVLVNFYGILWTLGEDDHWQKTIPPMPTLRGTGASAVSHGDHLLVIGHDYTNNKVYVYNGHHWASAQHPPQRLISIKSTVFNGHWYLMAREEIFPVGICVYSASLESLLASCQPSETEISQPSSLWKKLTDAPSRSCYPAVFGNRLVTIGRGSPPSVTTLSLHAYSSLTQSWVHMGGAPDIPSTAAPTKGSPPSATTPPLYSYSSLTQPWLHRGGASDISAPCAIVLPSNELIVLDGQEAFIVTLKSKSTMHPHIVLGMIAEHLSVRQLILLHISFCILCMYIRHA